jgi:hypothetical protein
MHYSGDKAMRSKLCWPLAETAVIAMVIICATGSYAASLTYVGSDFDIGGTFFSGGSPPYVVAPWRSNSTPKNFDIDGNNVYGSAGYAMFGTEFSYPTFPGCCGSSVPFASATHPNLVNLPSFVASSQALVSNKVGGWAYALVDDPTLVNGYRDYNWGLTQSPPRPGPDQSPYVKIGILDGNDIYGNDPKTAVLGAGRWAFTIGANPPSRFRVGVMTDGLDGNQWAATTVTLAQVQGTSILSSIGTGTLTRNRFIDIHTFDIVGAQAGDQFAFFAKASADGTGAISAITFDVVPEPSSMILVGLSLVSGCGWLRWGTKLG